jgi:glycosyltransferase involved in cell wall biosynthesis
MVARPDQTARRGDVDVLDSAPYWDGTYRWLDERLLRPLLRRIETWLIPLFRAAFRRRMNIDVDHERWYPRLASDLMMAVPVARAVRDMRPAFVFGHEVTTHGLATAFCQGVPRILFPWGADIYAYAESTPLHWFMARVALHGVDLVVPSSTTAAEHIVKRFGVASKRVVPVSWGVDLDVLGLRSAGRIERIRDELGIPRESIVILNSRRFRPVWGCHVALEAFLSIADDVPGAHFVLFGGDETGAMIDAAEREIGERGHRGRFTIFRDEIPLATVREVMNASDIFVSLLGRGDMRSSSVIEATAAGGVPVVADGEEYRLMERSGFRALFVDGESAVDVVSALRTAIGDADLRASMRAANDLYVRMHENRATQMDTMLVEIDQVCRSYGWSLEFERLGERDG